MRMHRDVPTPSDFLPPLWLVPRVDIEAAQRVNGTSCFQFSRDPDHGWKYLGLLLPGESEVHDAGTTES